MNALEGGPGREPNDDWGPRARRELGSFFREAKPVPDPFGHQRVTTQFILGHEECYIGNHPGTGKTRSCLDAIARERAAGAGKTLVFAPKAILESAWLDDCRKFTPHLKLSVARAQNRAEAFAADADIYVTNHDAAKWIAEHPGVLKGFHRLIVDESTAYKNKAAQRSNAVVAIRPRFQAATLMCGTPMPQGLIDLWNQYYILDGGKRLGASYYRFRFNTHEPEDIGLGPHAMKWHEKEGSREAVANLISDITLIYTLEECVDMPEQVFHTTDIDLSKKLRDAYDVMVRDAVLELTTGTVTAMHAAALQAKLLQICSGAVYDSHGNYHLIDTSRYELIAELCAERECTIVAYWWRHQRDEMVKALKKVGITEVAVIDGEHARHTTQVVADTQAGKYRVVLAQPKSASHGLTLTRAKTTIWASPTFESERYTQMNRRTYRIGQDQRTEVVHIRARNTFEEHAYERLQGKVANEMAVIDLLRALGAHHKEESACIT